MSENSQKFIARNRAPRVQIEYDVELYGSQKTVQLPFVMGVLSDLAGKSRVEQPAIADRKFLEIDSDTFDDRMQAMAPRVAFAVPNTLTGEGNLSVDLTFEKMSDFSPAAIASKVDALRPLLEARTQLANLMAYMDGKAGAEALIERILAQPALLSALTGAGDGADHGAALDSLRALAPQDEAPQDDTAAALEALRAAAPPAPADEDTAGAVLEGLKSAAPEETAPEDQTTGVLDGLRAAAPQAAPVEDESTDALASLRAAPVADASVVDASASVLGALRDAAPEETAPEDTAGAALDSLAALDLPEEAAEDTDDLLADLAA
ncbi:type VI secretion system contractile sheath small subunit, partial [Antarcticimicrobium luteum]